MRFDDCQIFDQNSENNLITKEKLEELKSQVEKDSYKQIKINYIVGNVVYHNEFIGKHVVSTDKEEMFIKENDEFIFFNRDFIVFISIVIL